MEHGTKTDQRCSHKGGECDKLGHPVHIIVIIVTFIVYLENVANSVGRVVSLLVVFIECY